MRTLGKLMMSFLSTDPKPDRLVSAAAERPGAAACLGSAGEMEIFDGEIDRRQRVAQRYSDALAHSQLISAPRIAGGNTSAYAQYTVLSENRVELQARLKASKIPSVAYYAVLLHLQKVFPVWVTSGATLLSRNASPSSASVCR